MYTLMANRLYLFPSSWDHAMTSPTPIITSIAISLTILRKTPSKKMRFLGYWCPRDWVRNFSTSKLTIWGGIRWSNSSLRWTSSNSMPHRLPGLWLMIALTRMLMGSFWAKILWKWKNYLRMGSTCLLGFWSHRRTLAMNNGWQVWPRNAKLFIQVFSKIIKMFSGSYGQERKAMRTYFKILYMIMAISWSTCF